MTLRPWEEEDASFVVDAFKDPEIKRWTVDGSAATSDQIREGIRSNLESFHTGDAAIFAITDANTRRPVGQVGLVHIDRVHQRAEAISWLSAEARGHGFATRALQLLTDWAFSDLSLRRVELFTIVGNRAAAGVAERAGFVCEGVLRSYREINGEQVDMTAFSLLATDPRS